MSPTVAEQNTSPWMTIEQASMYAGVGAKTLYRAIRRRRLRAAVIDGRRTLRLRREWIDQWLEATATPVDASRLAVRVTHAAHDDAA
jgi:excisionase family DNA binding protein